MKLKEIGEFGLIERISKGCLIRPSTVVKAIGDDAAAVRPDTGQVLLITTDLLVERIHFLRTATTGFNLGHKALAVNLSDIAAMGGTARDAFVSIAIPEDCPVAFIEDLYRGMKQLAGRHGVNILGGDTTRSTVDLVINVALTGEVPEARMLLREGARPGDVIYATGCLGDSRAGLHLILNGLAADANNRGTLLEAHLLPRPHLEEGRFLAGCKGVRAAIDVSDGLSSDLGRILSCSNAGARIHRRRLPLSESLRSFCGEFGFDAAEYALRGGEDYVLLCTIAPEATAEVAAGYVERFGPSLHPIGEITDTGRFELVLADGSTRTVSPTGWDHFTVPA